ncbi:hypothetical protein G7Z17_g1917 [Cylindrodendrum hubeiense]|uniref:Uncharacterized protein n=1 Tax=Cylindrodendrum hubeiense TaxID=595255 RepID=A0A9P5LLL0_9HYPO|nr:hypothetical protein G7Z17_g1917 [Cylindrodendrum hubeiense]
MDADGTDPEETADFDGQSFPLHILSVRPAASVDKTLKWLTEMNSASIADIGRSAVIEGSRVVPASANRSLASSQQASNLGHAAKEPSCPTRTSSEDKIDNISRKLDRICSLVDKNGPPPTRSQDGPLSGQSNFVTQRTPGSYNSSPVQHTQSSEDASGSDYEGELSLTAHATFATNFAQQAVNNNHPLKISPAVTSSLDALRRTLVTNEDRNDRSRALNAQLISSTALVDGFQMPPINLAMAAVQSLRSSARARIFCCLEFESVGQFVEYFFTVYSGQPSIADLIIVNCSLERLLIEYGNSETDESRQHKTLALRLGRSSTIRDCDITLPRMDSETVADGQLDAVLPKWIDIAILHGKVYDDIYSPGALLQPEDVRVTRARALATEMQRVFDGESPAEVRYLDVRRRALGDSTHELLMRADRISYLADLTLIYRSIPSGPYSSSAFCDECIATANRGLEEHKKCIALLRDIEGDVLELYIQWALLSSPFVPFIVIFCHVIETSAPLHLEKLAAVVETLQMLPPDYPEAYKKQLRLFKRMYDVACKYVEVGASVPSGQAQSRGPEGGLEAFFKEAGIALPGQTLPMPDSGQQNPQLNPGVGFGVGGMGSIEGTEEGLASNMENPSFELGNWFDQNYQILKMMEDGI